MEKRYVVELSPAERQQLEGILRQPRASRFRQTRARLLLKADEGAGGPGWTDAKICEAFDLSPSTVLRARKQLVEEGLEATLERSLGPGGGWSALPSVQSLSLAASQGLGVGVPGLLWGASKTITVALCRRHLTPVSGGPPVRGLAHLQHHESVTPSVRAT